MATHIFKPLEFDNRLRKYLLMSHYLNFLSTEGNLKKVLLKAQMAHFDKFVGQINFFIDGLSDELKQTTLEKIRSKTIAENERDIDDYIPIILNQTLVMLCTIFDTYLYDCLDTVLSTKKDILKGQVVKAEIDLNSIIDANSHEAVITSLKTCVLSKFDFMGIKDKLKLFEKLGVDIKTAYNLEFHNKKLQSTYPDGQKFLYQIYDKRKQVVHKNMLPIKNYEELSHLNGYLSAFLFDFAEVMSDKFKIDNDFRLFFKSKPPGIDPNLAEQAKS